MEKAVKLPSGSWRVRAYDKNTGKRRSFTADTKREAELLAADWLRDAREKPADLTLDRAIGQYIDSKSNTLSPSTIRGYQIARRNAYETIKNKKLEALTEKVLQAWANENAAKYSAKSINNQVGLLSAVLKQNKIRMPEISLKPREKTDYNIPSPAELSMITEAIRGKPCEIPVLIAMMCGCRQSEIAALRWEDYDGEGLHIHAAVVPGPDGKLTRKERPKSYAGNRVISVPLRLREALDAADRCTEEISPYRTPSGVLRAFQTVCEGLGLTKYKMHELRHAYASVMLLEGVPDKYAMELLGQSTPHMIKQVYQHTFQAEQKKAAKKVTRAFDKIAKSG